MRPSSGEFNMQYLKGLLPLVGSMCLATPALAQDFAAPPAPPPGSGVNQLIPAHDPSGNYATPNHNLSREQAAWHVRAALNVAALGCRDAFERDTVAAYNQLLDRHKAPLADADTATRAQFRVVYGAAWQDQHDGMMTKVYNFFAQPPAHDRFCAAARIVLDRVLRTEPAQFVAVASASLPELEAPFTDFYRAYDQYRVALADWRAGRGAPVVVAAAAVPAAVLVPVVAVQADAR
jgi:hypothetical protein